MNEHRVTRKSHDALQEKWPHVLHFNVPRDWFETNSRHQNRYCEGGKQNRGCRGLLGGVVTCAMCGKQVTCAKRGET